MSGKVKQFIAANPGLAWEAAHLLTQLGFGSREQIREAARAFGGEAYAALENWAHKERRRGPRKKPRRRRGAEHEDA